jgi:hypothetical protein
MSNGSSLMMLTALMIAGMVPAWASGTVWDLQGHAMSVLGMASLLELVVTCRV